MEVGREHGLKAGLGVFGFSVVCCKGCCGVMFGGVVRYGCCKVCWLDDVMRIVLVKTVLDVIGVVFADIGRCMFFLRWFWFEDVAVCD